MRKTGGTNAVFSSGYTGARFRDAEVVEHGTNVKVLQGGEVVSSCGTHLGHNIPDQKGSRYCINLLCIAGTPQGESGSHAFIRTDKMR